MRYGDEYEQQIGKREGVDAMIDTESVSDVGPRKPTGGWTTEDQVASDTTAQGTRAWQDMAKRQALQAEQQRMDAFQQKLDGYAQLEGAAKLQAAAINQDRGTALLAMMDSIRKNGGTMSPALNQAMSESFGFPVTGALLVDSGKQAGTLIIGTPQKGADGQVRNGVGMLISPEQRYQIFKNLNGGQYTEPYMAADFAAIKKSSGLTDDQLASKGFTNPMTMQTVGTTNISGSMTNRLLGRPQQRSSISAVGFDGKGRKGVYESNAGTGYSLNAHDEDLYGNAYVSEQQKADEERKAGLAAKVAGAKDSSKLAIAAMQEAGRNRRNQTTNDARIEAARIRNEKGGGTGSGGASGTGSANGGGTASSGSGTRSSSKNGGINAEMLDTLVRIVRDTDAMKNPEVAKIVAGVEALNGIGDGKTAPRDGIGGALDAASEGDKLSRSNLTDDELKAVDAANPPDGWTGSDKEWNDIKQKNPLAVLGYLKQYGRQLDGGEQLINYYTEDEDGNRTRVSMNGFRDRDGRIYGIRKGADGKNYRGDEIKDAKGTFKNLGNGKYKDTPFEKEERAESTVNTDNANNKNDETNAKQDDKTENIAENTNIESKSAGNTSNKEKGELRVGDITEYDALGRARNEETRKFNEQRLDDPESAKRSYKNAVENEKSYRAAESRITHDAADELQKIIEDDVRKSVREDAVSYGDDKKWFDTRVKNRIKMESIRYDVNGDPIIPKKYGKKYEELKNKHRKILQERNEKSNRMRKAGDEGLKNRPSISDRVDELRAINNRKTAKSATSKGGFTARNGKWYPSMADYEAELERAENEKSERMRKAGDEALKLRRSVEDQIAELIGKDKKNSKRR